jgi:hypothetical protein
LADRGTEALRLNGQSLSLGWKRMSIASATVRSVECLRTSNCELEERSGQRDSLPGPVLHFEPAHPTEFFLIVGHQRQPRGEGVRGNP